MNTILNQNRSFNHFIVAGIVTVLVLVAVFAIATSAGVTTNARPNVSQNVDTNTRARLAVYPLNVRTLVNPLAPYLASERTLSPIVNADLSTYHLSERAMTEEIDINNLAQYFASERTLVDPQIGWTTYFESERTSIPESFNQYQLSEWFGE